MRKGMGLLIAMCILLSGIMLAPPVDSGEVENSTNALTPHAPIRIDSNADFSGIATGGDGNLGSPWEIENWSIDGTGVGYCIYVGNTTDHFVVRNCSLENASGNPWPLFSNAGLFLYDCESGVVDNITASWNEGDGVHGEYFNNSQIINSTAMNNGRGYYLDSSNNSLINNNTGSINTNTGFWINDSENTTVSNNTAYSNGLRGISNGNSKNNIIRDNNVSSNEFGIYPYYCENITIDNNTLAGNGIYILGTFIQEWNSHNITSTNLIGGKPVYYEKNQNGGTIPPGTGQVILANCSNMVIDNQNVSDGTIGILLGFSDNNTIANNSAWNNHWEGITLLSSSKNNSLINNTISNSYRGIWLYSSGYNEIEYNNISGSEYGISLGYFSEYNVINNNSVYLNSDTGIYFGSSSYNMLYHNNITDNFDQVRDSSNNVWNLSYPSGGNYWSDYTGPDHNFDGIGDIPYDIDADSRDNYPLMQPWTSPLSGDYEPPLALDYSPNSTETPISATIQIVWNETMNWTSVEGAFNYTDMVNNYSSANGTWQHNSTSNISTFTPADNFAYETQYFVAVNCTATDLIGNALDQNDNGTGGEWPADVLEWNFTTTDEAPYVVFTSPANDQALVDPNTTIIITFSESMNQSAVEDSFSYTNGTVIWNAGNGTEFWNADRTVFTFVPAPSLEKNQTFTVSLNGSMARDIGGKIMGSNYTWSFTTWLEPPPPHVTVVYPLSGAFNVPVNTHINLAFDVEMDVVTVQDAFTYTDGTGTWDASNGTVDWYSGNTLFSFQPTELLIFDSTYTVVMGTNASSIYGKTLDGNDNGVSEPNDDFVFTFTTALEPPTIVSHYPAADQYDVSTSLSTIYINFSKPMDTTSVTNGVSIYPNTGYTPSFSADQKNLTLLLNDELLEGTQYRITVMNTAQDLVGTGLDGNGDGASGDRFTFVFITEGMVTIERPRIVEVFPRMNSTIPIDPFYVAIAFSQEMNRTSVQDAFSFGNSTAEINGTFTWIENAVRFMPNDPLEYNETYFVSVAGTARNIDGLSIDNSTSWQYTTESEEVPTSLGDLVFYVIIIILLALTIMLYMANRSLRMDLKKNRVKMKRAMKKYDFTEDDLKKKKPKKVEAAKLDGEIPEVEETPDDVISEEVVPDEVEPVKPEPVDKPDS